MPKATSADVMNEGFRAEMFGAGFATPADFTTFVQSLVDAAGNWAAAKIGTVIYGASSTGYAFDCLKRAEVCFASARLWKRRVGFADSAVAISNESNAYLNRREYLAHEAASWECAQHSLAEAMSALGIDPSALGDVPQMATGYIETGRYPQSSEAPINV